MINDLEVLRKQLLAHIHLRKHKRTQEWARLIGVTAKDLIAFFMHLEATDETVNKIKEFLRRSS